MAEDNPLHPLTPSTHLRSHDDPESATPSVIISKRSEPTSKLLVYILATLVSVFAVLFLLASIFLRVQTPQTRITSVTVKNLRLSSNRNASSAYWQSLNATLATVVSIKNDNFGGFEFKNSSASFLIYGNMTVGSAKIGEGRAQARGTKTMNVTVDLRADNRLSNLTTTDLLELTAYAKVSGEVEVMNMMKRHKSAEMNCSVTLNLTSHAIQNFFCNS